jgi:hypothetical protein
VALPAGSFRLVAAVDGSPLLAERLALDLVAGGRILYSGSLARFQGLRIEGDQLLGLRLSLPSTGSAAGDNALQGLALSASFKLG